MASDREADWKAEREFVDTVGYSGGAPPAEAVTPAGGPSPADRAVEPGPRAEDEEPRWERGGRRSRGRRGRRSGGERQGLAEGAPLPGRAEERLAGPGNFHGSCPDSHGSRPDSHGSRPDSHGSRPDSHGPCPDPRLERDQDDVAADRAVDLPAWVEPEAAEPYLAKATGRPELLPAGAGIDPNGDESAAAAPPAPPAAPRFAAADQKRILINASDTEEVRIAVLENGQLEELYYERPDEKKYLGNIYKGRVVNLEPAIQAAFVEIGIGRNGFLHVSDVVPAYKDAVGIPVDQLSMRYPDRRRLKIQDILKKGQELLVQISKDAIGAKGPSLTTYVSVPGKYLVLMPGVNRHGVSKRIQEVDERADLRGKLAQLNLPAGLGFIVRTAGYDRPLSDLEKDFEYLRKVWDEIRTRSREAPAGTLVYSETDIVIRAMRDLFGPDVGEMLIDGAAVYERAKAFLIDVMPQAAGRLRHYSGPSPLFSRFGVEEEIEKIYNRRVPLPSGGYIVLEQTEALVAIDVNSGKFRDEEDLESTALKTNLEAAQEIARQLRLRDLGGVIVNDFIDMESEPNRRTVERALRAALKRDRAKSWISRISRFGIIEMTRQRVRPSFERSNHEPCKFCRGTGVVKSARSSGIAILRQIRAALTVRRRESCEVIANPAVVEYLLNDRRTHLVELEKEFKKTVLIKADPTFSPDQYVVRYH